MKESDTPLGKAYAKAKESNPPPPKEGDVNIEVSKSSDDAVVRRYQRVKSYVIGAEVGAEVVYDKVKNKIMLNLTNQKTNQRQTITPFDNPVSDLRNYVVNSVKNVKGQPLSKKELEQTYQMGTFLADSAAQFKAGPKYNA